MRRRIREKEMNGTSEGKYVLMFLKRISLKLTTMEIGRDD